MADVPEEERGTIPIYRLISMDYVCQIRVPRISADVQWGAKPKNVSNNAYYWGITEDGEWSYHVLGQEWIATSVSLPNCTHADSPGHGRCLTSTPIYRIQLRNTVLWAK